MSDKIGLVMVCPFSGGMRDLSTYFRVPGDSAVPLLLNAMFADRTVAIVRDVQPSRCSTGTVQTPGCCTLSFVSMLTVWVWLEWGGTWSGHRSEPQ